MKVIEINTVNYGSTGKIAIQVAKIAEGCSHQVYVCSSGGRKNSDRSDYDKKIYIGGFVSEKLHLLLGRITGLNDCFSYFATRKFLKKIKKINPDIIHIHNLHNCYINISLLFDFIQKNNIKTVWTLHDCWAFTGKCPYFDMANCYKWKEGCYNCPQKLMYPKSFIDSAKLLYNKKKKIFGKINNLTLVTPSKWLAEHAKNSFLGKCDIRVINNGIDLSVFNPRESDFRTKYNCEEKFIILGVAFGWGKRKGLDVFKELANKLNEKFQIVLVGTDDAVDKELPDNIISIHRTDNQIQLAEIYSAADVFVNPTREENYPTVNMEAIACGTPVITFNTGGSAEIIDDTCGISVEKNAVEEMLEKIIFVEKNRPFSKQDCLIRAEQFDSKLRYDEYVSLYEEIYKCD